MYLVTLNEFEKLLTCLSERNVRVRIITDFGQDEERRLKDKVPGLQRQGIEVKCNSDTKDGALMHNKFVIIDNRVVLSGSFNWTAKAVLRNFETVIVNDESAIVNRFVGQFRDLWQTLPDRPV